MSHPDRIPDHPESGRGPEAQDDATVPFGEDSGETLPSGEGPAAPRRAGAALPDRIGEYAVSGELGRGGMGVVYVAEDPRLRRQIAIKVLPQEVARDPQWLARFEREARLLAALNHPNIATIHSLEEARGLRFLTLELIAGENLSARIASGPLAVDDTLAVCRQIAAALEAAHKKGVVHLDMKPGNVRITPDGLVKVLDFGLARALRTDSVAGSPEEATGDGITGTPGYMSPEQVTGAAVDHRADLWALGCILYECLTGQRAIRGETLREVFAATLEPEPEWQALPEDLPGTLRNLLVRCLATDMAERPENAAELRRAIEEAIQERALSALAYARRQKSDAAPNNLPVQITSFVGRQRERAELRELLERTRLLTLSGMGGSGKTRLALEVAREVIADYADGTWLAELAPLTSPQFVPQTVATVLGLKEEPNRPLTDTVVAHLRERRVLLILDNCEHLLPDCTHFVAKLLGSCPELRVIATSREGLGITGESIYQVTSLGVPAKGGRELSLEELKQIESVELFLERANAVKSGFALTEENAPATVEICRRLDGIPLAIELAVARVKMMSVEEIASRLDDRFRLLTGGSRTALPHHKTLRALIDWSYEGLTEHEAALMRRLASFAGGWTLDAAAAVGAGEDLEEWEVLDLLSRLVDKSLVELDAEGGQRTGKTRYRMLETVRSYARERLDEQGETDSVRRRHLDYFLNLAEEAEPCLVGEEQGLWLSRLEAEHDNLRVAFDACKGGDHALGLRLAGALGRFWEVHGHWSEGREACAALTTQPDGGDPAIRAKVLICAGNLALHQGDAAEARRLYEESLEIRRELGDKQGIAQSLNSVGLVAWIRGDYDTARSFYEESLELGRELGDPRGTASSLNNLGNLARDQGNYEAARSFHEESLVIKRQLGDQRGIASSLNNLGVVLRRLGDNDQARAFYEESLEIRRELGYKQGIAQSLNSLGNLAEERGDYDQARALYVESLAIKRELGDRRGVAVSLFNLGDVLRRQGDFDGARKLLEESLGAERELGSRRRVAVSLHQLGVVVQKQGDRGAARSFLAESLAIRREVGDHLGVAEVLASIALMAASGGDSVRAARLLGAADGLGEELGSPDEELGSPDEEQARCEAALRASMGEAAFEKEWAGGKALPLEQAIQLALGEELGGG